MNSKRSRCPHAQPNPCGCPEANHRLPSFFLAYTSPQHCGGPPRHSWTSKRESLSPCFRLIKNTMSAFVKCLPLIGHISICAPRTLTKPVSMKGMNQGNEHQYGKQHCHMKTNSSKGNPNEGAREIQGQHSYAGEKFAGTRLCQNYPHWPAQFFFHFSTFKMELWECLICNLPFPRTQELIDQWEFSRFLVCQI